MSALIGSRGMFSADAHENVIPSLMAAPPWADGVYINVRLTSDGEAVLMHDATVQRTTNGAGAVDSLTLAQIQALDAGGGATVPTLAEYLQAILDLEAAQPNRRPLSQIFINVADESLASVTEAYNVATDNTFSALHDRYVWIWGLGSSTTGATNLRSLDATARIGTWHSIGSASDATAIMTIASAFNATTILAFPGGYAEFPDAVDLLTAGGYQSGLSRTENLLTVMLAHQDPAVSIVFTPHVDRLPFWHEDITHVESWPLIRRLLPGSHTVRVEARVVSGRPTGGDPDGVEISVLGGDVQMDGTAKVRSTLQLITDGDGMWPRAKNTLLAPYGNEVFVRYGIDLGSHVKWWPLGYFRIQSPEQDQAPDGPIRLSGQDRMAGIIRGRFLVPRQYQATDTYGDVVSDLVGDIYPNAVIAWDDNTYLNVLGRAVVFEEDRYGALRDLVDSLGKIAWWDEWGILRIATAPDPDEILWEVEAGKNGVLLESSRRLSDDAVRNAWVYIGEGTDNLSPARGIAIDDNPRSPTWFFGDFGQVPGFHASPLLLTPAQARNAALARLRRTTGLISSVDFGVVTNPILRPYNAIRIRQKDRNRERHVVERVVIPLTPGQNMTGTTREQTFAGGGVVL